MTALDSSSSRLKADATTARRSAVRTTGSHPTTRGLARRARKTGGWRWLRSAENVGLRVARPQGALRPAQHERMAAGLHQRSGDLHPLVRAVRLARAAHRPAIDRHLEAPERPASQPQLHRTRRAEARRHRAALA